MKLKLCYFFIIYFSALTSFAFTDVNTIRERFEYSDEEIANSLKNFPENLLTFRRRRFSFTGKAQHRFKITIKDKKKFFTKTSSSYPEEASLLEMIAFVIDRELKINRVPYSEQKKIDLIKLIEKHDTKTGSEDGDTNQGEYKPLSYLDQDTYLSLVQFWVNDLEKCINHKVIRELIREKSRGGGTSIELLQNMAYLLHLYKLGELQISNNLQKGFTDMVVLDLIIGNRDRRIAQNCFFINNTEEVVLIDHDHMVFYKEEPGKHFPYNAEGKNKQHSITYKYFCPKEERVIKMLNNYKNGEEFAHIIKNKLINKFNNNKHFNNINIEKTIAARFNYLRNHINTCDQSQKNRLY
jgi:hypothetical protein